MTQRSTNKINSHNSHRSRNAGPLTKANTDINTIKKGNIGMASQMQQYNVDRKINNSSKSKQIGSVQKTSITTNQSGNGKTRSRNTSSNGGGIAKTSTGYLIANNGMYQQFLDGQ